MIPEYTALQDQIEVQLVVAATPPLYHQIHSHDFTGSTKCP